MYSTVPSYRGTCVSCPDTFLVPSFSPCSSFQPARPLAPLAGRYTRQCLYQRLLSFGVAWERIITTYVHIRLNYNLRTRRFVAVKFNHPGLFGLLLPTHDHGNPNPAAVHPTNNLAGRTAHILIVSLSFLFLSSF